MQNHAKKYLKKKNNIIIKNKEQYFSFIQFTGVGQKLRKDIKQKKTVVHA